MPAEKIGFDGVPKWGLRKKEKNTPMRKFKEKFKDAIDMKWKGFKYREIAERLGVSLDTVKSWFRNKGILRMHYKDYVEDRFIIRKQEQEKRTKTHENTPNKGGNTGINGKLNPIKPY